MQINLIVYKEFFKKYENFDNQIKLYPKSIEINKKNYIQITEIPKVLESFNPSLVSLNEIFV
jgi:hypothetical protein